MATVGLSTVWYGGVQILLGIIVAIPSWTLPESLSTTIALCVSLLLTGIYALLGSSYIKSTRQLLEASRHRDPEGNAVTEARLVKIHGQFLRVYAAACGVLTVLSLAVFAHGTVIYLMDESQRNGAPAAIAGVAALVINIFIAGSCIGDYKRLRDTGYERPRSPTPNSDPRMDISTIPVNPAIAFPPPYSHIHLDPKDDDYELPPSYLDSTSPSTSTSRVDLTSPPPGTTELALAVPFCMGEPVVYSTLETTLEIPVASSSQVTLAPEGSDSGVPSL